LCVNSARKTSIGWKYARKKNKIWNGNPNAIRTQDHDWVHHRSRDSKPNQDQWGSRWWHVQPKDSPSQFHEENRSNTSPRCNDQRKKEWCSRDKNVTVPLFLSISHNHNTHKEDGELNWIPLRKICKGRRIMLLINQ